MKKFLLPEEGQFYKANLHCHSTYSDGKLAPEELKKIYKEEGYSILAYTDHNVLISHSELADESFLPLNGYELDVTEVLEPETAFCFRKTCHFCLIALDPDNLTQVCFHRSRYFGKAAPHAGEVVFDDSLPDYERVYTPECINDMMKKGRDSGFFVTYNHPTWSLESYEQYMAYEHMNAMEICNNSCLAMGYNDYNPRVYDDILRSGKRILCIATDDNHNGHPRESGRWDSFGGFTMIKADRLEYKPVTDALVKGNFYASQAPLIHSLWFEDGKVHITCSDARCISMDTGIRKSTIVYGQNGAPVTEASFDITKEMVYFRLTVTDERGKHANTNAYFTDELFD